MKKITFLVLFIFIYNQITILSQDKKPEDIEPAKPALVIIDIQNQYLTWIPEQEKEIAMYYINNYISLFRSNDLPVIRVYHTDPEYGPSPESEEFQYPDDIQIKPDDPMIIKNYASNIIEKAEKIKKVQELELAVESIEPYMKK